MPCSFNNDEKTDTGCFPLSIDVVEGGRQMAESQEGSLLCELYLLSLIKFKGSLLCELYLLSLVVGVAQPLCV